MSDYPRQIVRAQRPDGYDLTGEPGDCFRTALAIVLAINPGTVPNFARHNEHGYDAARTFLRARRLDLAGWLAPARDNPEFDRDRDVSPTGYSIATGKSPRGPYGHCVVVDTRTQTLVHDPHPSDAGLAGPVEWVDVVVAPYFPGPRAAIPIGATV